MSRLTRVAVPAAALLALMACSERPTLIGPRSDAAAPAPIAHAQAQAPERSIHERLARQFALALRNGEFRAAVAEVLRGSRLREGKIHVQAFLGRENGKQRRLLAEHSGSDEAAVAADLTAAAPMELYLPVPEHRRAWQGDANILVATAEHDEDAPIAFDAAGRRLVLDPNRAPATPVLALGRAEIPFAVFGPAGIECLDCTADDGSGSEDPGEVIWEGPAPTLYAPGLWLTYARFNSTFEGWLKGAPEFEVHMLGQDGGSQTLKSYQCAGESAGFPYQFNQDDKTWYGNVMLFSQTQLDAYKAAHPDQSLRVMVLEDDDARCVIKTDSTRIGRMLQAIKDAYGVFTGGKDTQILSVKTFKNAMTLLNMLKSVWSFFQTQDDVVGFAIEDVVAREYWSGANWIVKGENNTTNGALRLQMR